MILKAEHLLDQAEALIELRHRGFRRQADRKRAVSTAYYAVFHAILTAAADMIVGEQRRGTAQYATVYRSLDHKAIKTLCVKLAQHQLDPKLGRLIPDNGWGQNLPAVFKTFVDLYEARHLADYDPLYRVSVKQAQDIVSVARVALRCFYRVSAPRRRVFLMMLLFPPRF